MGDPTPSTDQKSSPTNITDVDIDSLVQCSSYLSLRDISNMAMSCKYLQGVAYSDSIWQRFYRDRWPKAGLSSLTQAPTLREAYLARHTAVQQLKFIDPVMVDLYFEGRPYNFLHMSKNDIFVSQGSVIHTMKINSLGLLVTLADHRARVTSMLLVPAEGISLCRNDTQRNEDVLVTSSLDHSIRLWWKGRCQRCFRGHNGPVSTLSDKLLDDGSGKVFASGGEDCTVRLWSLSSNGKRGQHALKATLYGHEKPIVLMSVAGHRPSLLVSISRNSKMRVWDTTVSSTVRSSCCVGIASVPCAPVQMRCHESLVYVGGGSSVVAIDLRTMQRVYTLSNNGSELHSFEIMPSKSLICTGGIDRATLWDIRRNHGRPNSGPVAELEGHTGPVKSLHMDSYKIVTGSPKDPCVNVWDLSTGIRANMLPCHSPIIPSHGSGCSALAVNGCRIITGCWGEEASCITFRDFANATCPASSNEDELDSKFWGPQAYSDTDECDL